MTTILPSTIHLSPTHRFIGLGLYLSIIHFQTQCADLYPLDLHLSD